MNINEQTATHFEPARCLFFPVFKFKQEDYPGAVDPNLDDRPVLVLFNRSNDGERCYYSFHNMTGYIERICQEARALMIAHMKTAQAE